MLPPPFDDTGMPVRLGSPLRTPCYAWPNWGISYQDETERETLVEASEQCYRSEWDQTSQTGHEEIAAAAKEAGLGDANARLNAAIGQTINSLVGSSEERSLRILDLGAGAGATSLAVLEALKKLPCVGDLTLVDPAAKALEHAGQALTAFQSSQPFEFRLVRETDRSFLSSAAPSSFNLIVSGAAIHHHSDIRPILALCVRSLEPGGTIVIGDWHNSMWERPRRVLKLLECMEWPNKTDAIRRFQQAFATTDEVPSTTLEENRANAQIMAFWTAYGRLHRSSTDPFLILEGHRPVQRYVEDLLATGFDVPQHAAGSQPNPRFLLSDSGLLAVTVAIRPLSKSNG
jgi:SAM-dependent methyltransferase